MDPKTVDLTVLDPEHIRTWAADATPSDIDLLQSRLSGEWAKHWAARERADREMTRFKNHPEIQERYATQRGEADGKCQWYDRLRTETEDEYLRRGMWTRYFLVRGANGHVHSTTTCSTCNRNYQRTDFAWLTQYSGMPRDEFVQLAGERACTVCFPDAPVEKRSMLDDDVAERARLEKVRAERWQKKQEKKAKAIVFDDNDEPTYLRCANGERPKTKVSADRVAVAAWRRYLDLQDKAEKAQRLGNYEHRNTLESMAADEAKTVAQIVGAWSDLGHDAGTVEAGYKAKAQKLYDKHGY